MEELQQHPLSAKFPPLSPSELRELAKDIAAHGLHQPIILHEGKILDGWHRYQACLTENVQPRIRDFTGDDPAAFVMSMNAHRRHLLKQDQKRIAKELIKAQPTRTAHSIAKETGLHHSTVRGIQEEVEEEQEQARQPSNGYFSNSEVESKADLIGGAAIDDPGGPLDESLKGSQQRKLPPAESRQRVEATGKKARGRKPMSAEEKAASKQAREEAKSQAKRNANDRDAWVDAGVDYLYSDPTFILEEFVKIVGSHRQTITEKVPEAKRKQLVMAFANALSLRLDVPDEDDDPEEF
jgi:ParB-like chromosome segregation protein Spo0J